MADRLEMLQQMLSAQPGDAFTRYAIGMELVKLGRHDEALATYRAVLERTPTYVPAFQMQAQLLMELDRHEEALGVLQAGLAVAQSAGNQKAIGELGDLLAEVELVLG